MQSTDPMVLRFVTNYQNLTIHYEITLNPANYKNLKLNGRSNDMGMNHQFISPNEFQYLSVYFERKVASPPYRCVGVFIAVISSLHPSNLVFDRPNAAKAFIQLINQPPLLLKDCIRLIHQELQPPVELPRRWNISLCLTVPPNYSNILPVGQPAGKRHLTFRSPL